MKKIIPSYIILLFLITFLINTGASFPGMAANKSTVQPAQNNTTESDQDILLMQHLIELDTVKLKSENKLPVRETLVFYNKGVNNFSGSLRTWIPDGAEGIKVGKIEMIAEAMPIPVQFVQSGNIISWNDSIETNSQLPFLYYLEYMATAEPKDTLTKKRQYSKVFLNSALTKQSGSIILKVTRSPQESITINDEKGNNIVASGNPREEGNDTLYTWEKPEFKELNFEISESAISPVSPAGITGYVVLGILILLVLSYPILRKKSERLKAIEKEKLENINKRIKQI